MKKIIKQEMQEGKDGEIYEVTQFEEEFEDDIIESIRITRTPYRNQEVDVSLDTKSLIAKIAQHK